MGTSKTMYKFNPRYRGEHVGVGITLRRSRVRSDMRPLLAIPRRTAVRSAESGATAAGLGETAVAAAAAARGARSLVLAATGEAEGQTRRVGDGGEGDGERRKGAKSRRTPSIGAIVVFPWLDEARSPE
jgi:hypothetical protein